jgi:DnaD/phage-associated family protein
MSEPWIKLYRKFTEWEWYSDVNCKVVFLHLLLTANWQAKKWQGITVEVGELVTGREALAEAVGISVQQCRTALKKLVSSEAIEVESTKQFSKIKILNYKSYQNQPTTNQAESFENTDVEGSGVSEINQQLTNNQPTTNQRATTTEELKNDRNIEYIDNSGSSSIYNINNIYSESATASAEIEVVFKTYQENIGVLTPRIVEILKERITAQGAALVSLAVVEAVECGARNIRYVESILVAWEDAGVKTPEDVKLRKAQREQKKSSSLPGNVANSKFRNYPENYEMTEAEKEEINKMMKEFEECG